MISRDREAKLHPTWLSKKGRLEASLLAIYRGDSTGTPHLKILEAMASQRLHLSENYKDDLLELNL
jgi:hypothetical protein